jgi:5'-nucleotidase/UDP-sugar diphosphatase
VKRLSPLISLLALGLLSCMPLVEGVPFELAGQEVRLTLLHTSDIHSRLIPYEFSPLRTDVDLGLIPEAGPFGGATRMAAVLKRERAKAGRVLHLDSGDCFQGAPIFNLNLGEVEFRFLSLAGLDAAVVGNHEFDAGALNFATQARDSAAFPLLAANYHWDDHRQLDSHQAALYTSPYTIRNVSGLKVGIIGMANLSSLNSIVEGGNSLQITPLEQNEALRGYVELLRPVVDLIVITSHLGMHEDQDLVLGYEAYYEYGRIKSFLQYAAEGGLAQCDETILSGSNGCAAKPQAKWTIKQWFGPPMDDKSVVRVHIPGVVGVDVIMGGHLHVVLNPPQTVADPAGRKVVLSHSGAFAKYVGRLDLVVKVPGKDEPRDEGAEVVSHTYRAFPLDSLWCDEAMRAARFHPDNFWAPGAFKRNPQVQAALTRCAEQEDRETTHLLQPYILGMDFNLSLSSIFGYAPTDVGRRNNATGGDSRLGNLAADSMRKRRRVEAEMSLTNSLGIRDNLYTGPVTQESMFNVFPFENTINIMYLSGKEMQEMLDFVAARSAERGCVSQAQLSGARFVMDCAQAQLNQLRIPCNITATGPSHAAECPADNRDNRSPWRCVEDDTEGDSVGRCWAHPATQIQINGKPLDPYGTYKVAVNDYIAKGGSGFAVLKRNTTRIETGISLRDSLIGYMRGFCTCDDVNAGYATRNNSPDGEACGELVEPGVSSERRVNDKTVGFCRSAGEFKELLARQVGNCTCADVLSGNAQACGVESISPELRATCGGNLGPSLGRCSCAEALAGDAVCGYVTPEVRAFCRNPTSVAVISGVEDGRIGRRVK